MSIGIKTDNHNPAAKLLLRRHFLGRFHPPGTARVLDCCQGAMKLWAPLRDEFRPAEYLGVDLKPAPGRLRVDSVRLLAKPGWDWNVVDIDTYGSPWRHWIEILRHAPARPVTVFLTIGLLKTGMGPRASNDFCIDQILGCQFARLKVPPVIRFRLAPQACMAALSRRTASGLRPIEILEAFPQGNARYIGVRLAP
jgi:hypothetical protein